VLTAGTRLSFSLGSVWPVGKPAACGAVWQHFLPEAGVGLLGFSTRFVSGPRLAYTLAGALAGGVLPGMHQPVGVGLLPAPHQSYERLIEPTMDAAGALPGMVARLDEPGRPLRLIERDGLARAAELVGRLGLRVVIVAHPGAVAAGKRAHFGLVDGLRKLADQTSTVVLVAARFYALAGQVGFVLRASAAGGGLVRLVGPSGAQARLLVPRAGRSE
jgi:hypothetical protein